MRVRPPQAAGHGKKGVSVIRHIFIINPAAGKRETTRRLDEQLSRLSVPHEVFYTREAGEARKIAERAAAEGVSVRRGSSNLPHLSILSKPLLRQFGKREGRSGRGSEYEPRQTPLLRTSALDARRFLLYNYMICVTGR